MEDHPTIQRDSAGWQFFVRVCFALALGATGAGLLFLPVNLWVKGYMAMGVLFTVGSTITLTKTVRDEHEARKLLNRIAEAKATKLLKEYETDTA